MAYYNGEKVLFSSNVRINPVGRLTEDGGEIFNDYKNNNAIGKGASAFGLESVAGVLGYYFTNIDFDTNIITLSKEQGVAPTESFEIGYKVGDVISIKNDREYVDCSTITNVNDNLCTITVDNLPFTSMYVKEKPAINDNAIYVALKPAEGGVPITEASFASGKGCRALGALSRATGYNTLATGYGATSEGSGTKALNWVAHAEGYNTEAFGDYSHAEGGETKASAAGAHAEGRKSEARGNSSHAEGKETVAEDVAAHAEGHRTQATAEGAHSEGKDTKATGIAAHTEGQGTKASGKYAHAEGDGTEAKGDSSHAGGIGTRAIEWAQYVHGRYNIPTYEKALVIGNGTSDTERSNCFTLGWTGDAWFAGRVRVGKDQKLLLTEDNFKEGATVPLLFGTGSESVRTIGCTSSGHRSFAEGMNTKALGQGAHSEGAYTIASQQGSHAEGYFSEATANYSHAEGRQNKAQAEASHAEGFLTTARGKYSHSEGVNTVASSEAQHVQGRYNIEDSIGKYAHIVGNGKDGNNRSNAHTLDWDGNAWFAGTVETTALVLKSPNGTKFKVTVKDDGTLTTVKA